MIKQFLYKYYIRFKRKQYISDQKKKGTIISNKSKGYLHASFEGKNLVPDLCNFVGNIKIGYATTLGHENLFAGDVTIGKYCQLGIGVAVHTTNHPMNYMSTYINNNLFKGELKTLKETSKVSIGNDVWIGHNVIIVGNVTIGNGAILAAGCVVTKDVPPYTIVGGVPAKIIRKRFPDHIIQEIEALQWWNLSDAELEKIKPLFFKNFETANSIYE